jgi:small-conductance mechanosensitive channel
MLMESIGQFTSVFQLSHLWSAALLVGAFVAAYLLVRRPQTNGQPPLVLTGRSRITTSVIRWMAIGVAALGGLLAIGVDLHGLWSMLGAVLSLVAIGFVAMWSILSHMFASILIVAFRPFEIDDHIEIVGEDPILGKVIELNLVYTTLRTADGGTLRIPNNLFFQKVHKRHAPVARACEQPSSA